MRIVLLLAGLLIGSSVFGQDWQQGMSMIFRSHQSSYPNQTVMVFIQSPDTSIFIKFGPKADTYSKETYFRAGGLLLLRQGYYIASSELDQSGFMNTMVRKGISAKQLLSHRSGYPRYPWEMDSCNFASFNAFLNNYKPSAKAPFQISYVGATLLEQWLRDRSSEYPETVHQEWNIDILSQAPGNAVAKATMIKHQLPINCWPFCLTCNDQAAYVQAGALNLLIGNMISDDNYIWLKMMEVLGKTPMKELQVGYGLQIATNLKNLPLAMHSSSDGGNAMFIAFTPTTKTAIAILSDSDEPVDNLGLQLMTSFHRDILNFRP